MTSRSPRSTRTGVVTSVGPGDTHVVAFYDNGVQAGPGAPPGLRPGRATATPAVPTPTKVDELVVAKLKKLGITPSPTCSDAEFLRRVGLDLTGTLPTPDEIEAFLSDPSPDKRARKVDELLARPTYAAWWTTKLCDYTGDAPKVAAAVMQFGPEAPRQWYDWIYKRVVENMPYDRIAAGLVLATSRPKGEGYDDFARSSWPRRTSRARPRKYADRETMPHFWARTNFRKPEERVVGFSYAFLGVRLECAQCHKHPFDQWTQDDFNRFGDFFNSVGYGVAPDVPRASRRSTRTRASTSSRGGSGTRSSRRCGATARSPPGRRSSSTATARPLGSPAPSKVGAPTKAGRVVSAKVLGGDEVAIAGIDDPRSPADGLAPEQGQPLLSPRRSSTASGPTTSASGSSPRPTT